MRRGAWSDRSRPRISRAGRMRRPSHWRPGREGTPRLERRGAAYLGAEGGTSAALPPPLPLSGRNSVLSAPLRPCSAPAPLRPSLSPSHPLSLPPARDCPRAPAGEFAVAGRARPERSGSPGQPSSPPRALSHLNFSEVRKGLPGSPARDSCTGPLLRWTRLRLFQPARGFHAPSRNGGVRGAGA